MKKADIINPLSGTKQPLTLQTLFGYVIGFVVLLTTLSFAQKVNSKVETATQGRIDTSPGSLFTKPAVSKGQKMTVI